MTQATGPAYLAHWVVKTARAKEMIDWYGLVFGAHVVHEDDSIAFLTWDEESHRLALIKLTSKRHRAGMGHQPRPNNLALLRGPRRHPTGVPGRELHNSERDC